MSDYRAATGHGVALVSLTVLDPQPASPGLEYTRVTYSASGVVYPDGPYIRLLWSALEQTDYVTVLTYFGLNSLASANVTIYALSEQLVKTRYNGRAIRPLIGRNGSQTGYFMRDVEIVVKDLVAL